MNNIKLWSTFWRKIVTDNDNVHYDEITLWPNKIK